MRRAGLHRVGRAHHGRQDLVIDLDQLGRVAALRLARGDDDGDALADIAHAVDRERHAVGAIALGAAHVLGHRLGIDRAELVGGIILAGQHREHARRRLGRLGVDRLDRGMGVRRIDEHRIGLARQIDIGDIASAAGEEARILLAR